MDRDTIERLQVRRAKLKSWLDDEAPFAAVDQKQRAYWHHGYCMALTDVLKLIGADITQKSGNEDSSI